MLLQFHKFVLILLRKEEGIASEWFLTESSKGSLKKPFFLKEWETTPEHLQ